MNIYIAMNWGAWALSAILFGWLIYDFIKTEKMSKESEILGTVDHDEITQSEVGFTEGEMS